MTLADVAKKTSSSLSSDPSTPAGGDEFEGGALFDETASAYARIQSRTESVLSELLTNNVRTALNSYTKINPWSSLSPTATAGPDNQVSTTAELDGLLQNLQTLITYLVRAVGTVPLRKLVKQMLQDIDRILFTNVILSHSFSGAGAAQLSVDLAAIDVVVAKLIDRNMVESGLGRVHQATALLNISIKAGKEHKDDNDGDGSENEKIGLFEAGKRLFEGSGEDAKELLDELGLDRLGVAEARKVLARRVELGS
jgi:RAD50-interacting protein 1